MVPFELRVARSGSRVYRGVLVYVRVLEKPCRAFLCWLDMDSTTMGLPLPDKDNVTAPALNIILVMYWCGLYVAAGAALALARYTQIHQPF